MQIELNTNTKTIRLQEKVQLADLIEFLKEHNLQIEDWSLDIYYGKVYQNVIGYPNTGVPLTSRPIPCTTSITYIDTNPATNPNVSYTK